MITKSKYSSNFFDISGTPQKKTGNSKFTLYILHTYFTMYFTVFYFINELIKSTYKFSNFFLIPVRVK